MLLKNKAPAENEAHSPGASDKETAAAPVPQTPARGAASGSLARGLAAALAALIALWTAASLISGGGSFATLASDSLRSSEEAASALARFFGALALLLFLSEREGWRMGWVAAGLVALGLGHLGFGYVEPMIQGAPTELDESLYEGLTARTVAGTLFVVGLLAIRPPGRVACVAAAVFSFSLVAAYIIIFEFMEEPAWVPPLTSGGPEEALQLGAPLGWLTPWYLALSAVPLALAVAATAGAFRQSRRGLLPAWLLFAMVLMAGASLHDWLWPSAYTGEVLTTADLLRLLFAVVVAVGGIMELKRIASEHARMLADERERTHRLGELAALRADFSAMVAHELGGPISAIRRLNEMLQLGGENPDIRSYTTTTIEGEVSALDSLVADVRSAAAAERDDFEVDTRWIPLSAILRNAEAYAMTLPGEHPVEVLTECEPDSVRVRADSRRIGQVIANLLSNAAKYSSAHTPIQLRVRAPAEGAAGRRVRLEVSDQGQGLEPDDLARIFEKFGRGRDSSGSKVAGVGLGLYISRRIVRSHGSELSVRTQPGEGSTFGFDLEERG